MTRFFRSNAPATRARRDFWIKQLVVFLWIASWVALAAIFEEWFKSHIFIGVLLALFAGVTMIAFGAAWRFRVPCPRCGWNINMPKDMWRPQWTVPSSCPNCGQDLRVEV